MELLLALTQEEGAAVSLLQRLRLPGVGLDVLHIIAPTDFFAYGYAPVDAERVVDAEKTAALQLVEGAARQLASAYPRHTTHVGFGNPTEEILRHAESRRQSWIVVNAAHTHSTLTAFLTGSVARALVIGAPQSVLVARPSLLFHAEKKPLRVVFATDHSEYADAVWRQFLTLTPLGIHHVTILTAYPKLDLQILAEELPTIAAPLEVAVEHALVHRNAALVQQSQAAWGDAVTFESVVSNAPVKQAIQDTMDATSADLLIVGAKGHGLLERLTVGSVALEQALGPYPYSVLILRK